MATTETSQVSKEVKATTVAATKPAKKASAAKAAAKPVKAVSKPAAKPAQKKAGATKAKPAKAASLGFRLYSNPSAGNELAAFFQAVMTVSGLATGGKIARANLQKVIGATAMGYHKNKGTFAVSEEGMVSLTLNGKDLLAQRVAAGKIDETKVARFVAVLTTGKADPECYFAAKDHQIIAI